MKKIVFAGGAVMKTPARELLREVLEDVEILCLNGGALFHDFQMALEGFTSVPLEELNVSMKRIEESCKYVVDWLKDWNNAPKKSIVNDCRKKGIPVLLFTTLGCDYWQMYAENYWWSIGGKMERDFMVLRNRFSKRPFHFINICSAVIGPEVFQKAIQGVPLKHIRADVVDFLDMYRPRTRVAKYGNYFKRDVEEFMIGWKAALDMMKEDVV